jgi:chromosomal replication initiator protein
MNAVRQEQNSTWREARERILSAPVKTKYQPPELPKPEEMPEPRSRDIIDLYNSFTPPALTLISRIKSVVAEQYGVTVMDLISSRRTWDLVRPRHVAMYLCKVMTPKSYPEIGRRFGNRDHATVMNAVRKITERIASDPEFAGEIAELREQLGGTRAE